ncbi:MAG: hypothetical protein FGM15_04635 [Chthoniobacterales bacterium]|nr:hypothetical protein [Chthoniobacterales bacterium]
MRTTLSLDSDVAQRLRQELASGKKSFKEVVNERLRLGFGLKRDKQRTPFRVKAHSSAFLPGIDQTKLNQLVDELEVDEFIGKSKSK